MKTPLAAIAGLLSAAALGALGAATWDDWRARHPGDGASAIGDAWHEFDDADRAFREALAALGAPAPHGPPVALMERHQRAFERLRALHELVDIDVTASPAGEDALRLSGIRTFRGGSALCGGQWPVGLVVIDRRDEPAARFDLAHPPRP